MPISTDDRRELLTVIANMRAKPGKEQELREALESLVPITAQEEGYVDYALHRAVDDPAVFYFYENWTSGEALDKHLAAPHLQDFVAKMGDLLDDSGLTIARLERLA